MGGATDLGGREDIANPERRVQQAICMGLDPSCLRERQRLEKMWDDRGGLQTHLNDLERESNSQYLGEYRQRMRILGLRYLDATQISSHHIDLRPLWHKQYEPDHVQAHHLGDPRHTARREGHSQACKQDGGS
jgi:hypothetical protein